jgi:hypothetical protein
MIIPVTFTPHKFVSSQDHTVWLNEETCCDTRSMHISTLRAIISLRSSKIGLRVLLKNIPGYSFAISEYDVYNVHCTKEQWRAEWRAGIEPPQWSQVNCSYEFLVPRWDSIHLAQERRGISDKLRYYQLITKDCLHWVGYKAYEEQTMKTEVCVNASYACWKLAQENNSSVCKRIIRMLKTYVGE